MVLLHTRVGTVAATLFAALLVWHLRGTLPDPWLNAWLGAKVLVAAARLGHAQAYTRQLRAQPHPGFVSGRWSWGILGLLALDGGLWGLAGWQLAHQPVPVAALATAALDGVSCVATFGLQVRLGATAAYTLPMLLPMALGLALRHDEVGWFGAPGQLILAGLLLSTAYATSRQLTGGMLLRLHAAILLRQKEDALKLAEDRSAERDRFLAKVSHELRTPLHGMLGLTRLIHLEASDPATIHRLELVEDSGTHLLALINDLLEVSSIGAGHFVLREDAFDLAALLDQVGDVFALRAADKGLKFTLRLGFTRPQWVRGDPARLRQVLNNLLGNAVKFTEQGAITLEAGPSATPDRVRLSVIDTGQGIEQDAQARIFQAFQQGQEGRQAPPTEGVGLGLTIAREIANAMRSDIEVSSLPGRGSRFTVEPLLPPARPDDAASAGAEIHTRLPRRVLVAEDDEVNALIVHAFLDGLGVRSERVTDGKQAVGHALRETDRPDLVLMDCRMPLMDGLSATAEIRRQERVLGLPRIPILALTATTTDAERRACFDCGMDEVVGKPFTPEQLAQAMRDAMARRAGAG
ncbi:ATP-binding protein [Ideonella sp. DXS22W]|uniref:histidine kinase n=1 Tax=Pseudaquabacterium inlustre TaxID=2984192 RepID=A0ABU9CBB3_9BURK